MKREPLWGDTGETGKFVSRNAAAVLSYIVVDGIFYLEYLDEEGRDFLASLDFGHEIALHKDDGDTMRMEIVDIAPRKAKIKA